MPSLHALQQTLRHQTFSAGEVSPAFGRETGDTFYMIVKGTVDVLETSVDPETGKQRTRVLVQMFEGHYFGELALIYGEPRNASVRATEEARVRCVCIAKEDFRSCMNEKRFQEVLEEVAYQRACSRRHRDRGGGLRVEEAAAWDGQAVSTFAFFSLSRGSLLRVFASVCSGGAGRQPVVQQRGLRPKRWEFVGTRIVFSMPSSSLTPPPPPHARSGSASSLRRSSFRETGKVVKRKLSNGTVVINKYRIICELGRGSYGSVHLSYFGVSVIEYAMKVMEKRRRGSSSIRSRQGGGQGAQQNHLAETLRREVAVMKKLRHPNIVTLWEVIDDPKAQQLYMIQEYVAEGPLLPEGVVVPPLGTEEAREKFVGCIRGLHYLHQHGVVHGDIKPQNLLVAMDGTVKIADFGAAVMLQQGEASLENEDAFRMPGKLICTPAFTPPELFGASTTVSPACDVWAMGVTLYQMVYGTLPFWPPSGNHTELEIMERQKGSRSSSSLGVSTNLEAYDPMVGYLRNLLRRMLEKDPEQRIDLTAAINHPWVTVEGSIRPEGLEISVEPGFSDDGGQVTDGDLLDAWTMFPATPTPRGREYAFSFSPRGPSQPSNRHQQHQQRAGQFFPPQERYVYGCPLGGSGHSSASQVSPYGRSTAAESWSQLTPTAMGNITRFGCLRGTESSGYASGGGVKKATREDDDEDEKNADSTYAESGARGPTRAEGGGGSRTPAERQGGARRGSLERRGGSGGVYGHAVRSVSPPSELPVHLPDDTPGAAAGDLRHQRSYGRGMGGSGVSAEGSPDGEWTRAGGGDALRFSGISKAERRSFCGPSGKHPRREREPPQSADSTMPGVNPSPRSDRISGSSRHFDRDAGLTYGSGPRAADGDVDGETQRAHGWRERHPSRIQQEPRRERRRSKQSAVQPRALAPTARSRSGGQGRRLMERCMTFPLASGQRAIHEAKLDSPSLRSTEVASSCASQDVPQERSIPISAVSPRFVSPSFRPQIPRQPNSIPFVTVPSDPGTPRNRFTRGVVPPRLSPGPAARRVPSAFFSAAPAASRLPLSSPLPDATAAAKAAEEDLAPAGRRAPGSIHLAAAFSADSSLPSQRQQRARSTSSLSPLSPPLGRRSAAPAAVAGPARGGPAAVGRKELDKSGGRIGTWREGDSDTGVSGGGDGVEPARQEARAGQARRRRASFSRALERCKDDDGSGGGGATVSSTISPRKGVSHGQLDHNRASLSRRIDAHELVLCWFRRQAYLGSSRVHTRKAESAGHERPPPRCRSEPPLTIGPRGTGSWPRLDSLEADKQIGASPYQPAGPRATTALHMATSGGRQPTPVRPFRKPRRLRVVAVEVPAEAKAAETTSTWGQRASDAGLRLGGQIGFDFENAAAASRQRYRRSSTGGCIGGSTALNAGSNRCTLWCVASYAKSYRCAFERELPVAMELRSAVSVDPDAIELALPPPPYALDHAEDLGLVGFEPLTIEDIPMEPVQARTWGDQANLEVGVRYGHTAEIGSRRVMEDRTIAVNDIFKADVPNSLRSRSEGAGGGAGDGRERGITARAEADVAAQTEASPAAAAGGAPGGAAPAASSLVDRSKGAEGSRSFGADAPGRSAGAAVRREVRPGVQAQEQKPRTGLSAAFFGVYDGHDGDVVAEALQQSLHKLIAKQVCCFRDSVPEAIERGCYEMDTACLEAQFRALGREPSLSSPGVSPGTVKERAASPIVERGCEGSARDTTRGFFGHLRRRHGGGGDSNESWRGGINCCACSLVLLHAAPGLSAPSPSSLFRRSSTRSSTHETVRLLLDCSHSRSCLLATTSRFLSPIPTHSSPFLPFALASSLLTTKLQQAVIHTGNVGDCRAVLCRGGRAIDLTSDHRPSRDDERRRVKEAGGFISRDRLNGLLGVTRAFGDIAFKQFPPSAGDDMWQGQQLTSQPETSSVKVHPDDTFVILACDGVWDLVSSQQVVSYVQRRLLKHRDVQRASRELCKTLGKMSGSDNCSCVITCLNQVAVTPTVYSPRPVDAGRHRQTASLSDAQVNSELQLDPERGFSWSAAGSSSPSPKKRPPKVYF
ncbi:unnamed protein product [Scytosiphon promiscuus]